MMSPHVVRENHDVAFSGLFLSELLTDMTKMTSNNNEINATLNGFIMVFIMSSVGSNSFRFTNFVLYAMNNDVLFATSRTM